MKSYAPPKLRQIVTEAVFRRKRIFLLTLYVVLGLVLLASLLMHKKYSAEAKLLVQQVRSQAPLTTSPSEHLMTANDVSTTEINNEVDLLQSAGVARLALGGDATTTVTPEQEKAVTQLDKDLTVEAVHQSSLINVKLIGASPQQVSQQLQRVIDAYFQQRQATARSSGAAEFFDQQAQSKSTQLDADQQALTDFEVAHQIADLDDQKKLQVTRVGTLQDQLMSAEAQLASIQSRLAAQKHQLALTPSRTRTVERSITNQFSQERLNTSLVDLENRRTELLKRYPATDRQVIEVNEKIATTRAAIDAAASSPAGEQATDVNPVYQTLASAVAVSTAEASGMSAQRAQLQSQVKDAQARLAELEQSTAEYDALKRKLAQSQADYTVYAQKRDEARVSEALDNARMFDVSLVQPPVASPDPVRPRPVLYMAAALAFALFLGTLLALYADTSADQVYTPAQLDSLTGTRTLATFADEDDADHHEDRNRVEYSKVLVAIRSDLAPATEATPDAHPTGTCVALTSALSGEGVTHLLTNLAIEAARQPGSRIALLDMAALFRKFESEHSVSFGMKYNDKAHFWTLALGSDDPASTSAEPDTSTQGQFATRLRPLLLEARKEFDILFLDCPSFQASTLATELAPCVDGYLAVVGAGLSRKQNIEQMAAVLRESRAPLLGYILNRRRYPVPDWLHRLIW